jgi:hypothetical protein
MQQKVVWCWHCVCFVVMTLYTQYMNIKVYVSANSLLYVFCRKMSRYAIFSRLVVHWYSMLTVTSQGCLMTQMIYMCPSHDESHSQMIYMCPLHDVSHSQIILTWNILLPIFWNFVAQRHVSIVLRNLVCLYCLTGGSCHDVMGCIT